MNKQSPFLGVYYDSNNQPTSLRTGLPVNQVSMPHNMTPFSGDFYDEKGEVHNISELGGTGESGTVDMTAREMAAAASEAAGSALERAEEAIEASEFIAADHISSDEGNALIIGTDDKFYVPENAGGGTVIGSIPDINYARTNFDEFYAGYMKPSSFNSMPAVFVDHVVSYLNSTTMACCLLPDGLVVYTDGIASTKSVEALNLRNSEILNATTNTVSVPNAFRGTLALPDGRAFCIAHNASGHIIYNPRARTISNLPTHGFGSNAAAYIGGVLGPDDKVYMAPYNATSIGIYDIATNSLSNGPALTRYFSATRINDPNKILFVPYDVGKPIVLYDINTAEMTYGPNNDPGVQYVSSVLLQDGRICLIGYTNYISVYNISANIMDVHITHEWGNNAFSHGFLHPATGEVMLIPLNYNNPVSYNITTNTFTQITSFVNTSLTFRCGTLLSNGTYLAFANANNTSPALLHLGGGEVGNGYCLHPYINK